MAQDGEVNVKVKITAENGGVVQAENGLKRVRNAAKKTASESKSGFEQMRASVGKVQGAFGALRNVLTGFGIGGFVVALTGGISKIIDSFGSAKKSADEFRAIQVKLAEEKGIASLANDYNKLTDAINAAAAAENHQLEMIDIEVANRRKLATAKMEADKEDEISKLDANAKDYAEQLDKIEKKYAALKAAADASNAREDLILSRQKMEAQAGQTEKQADAQDEASKAIEAKIKAARRAQSKADIEAVRPNSADKDGVLSAVGKTLGQLFTGDWGRMAGATTAEGDQIRQQAAERSAEFEKQIQALTEELRKSNEQAAKLRQDAKNTREKAAAMGGALEAAEIEGDTAMKTAARGETAAQAALDKNHAEQAAEAAKIADAEKARALLSVQKQNLQAQIAAQQQKKDAAALQVYNAQGTMDAARLGGNRGTQQSAFSNLQAAQDAAQNVNHAADTAINALTATLKKVEARLKAAQNFLESQSKQQRNAWNEAPAGE